MRTARSRPIVLISAALCVAGAATSLAQITKTKAAKSGDTIPNWGKVIDPDGDCQFTPGRTGLTFVLPKTPHALDGGKANAPRVMQAVSGDFEVTIRVAESPLGKLPNGVAPKDAGAYYRSAGILVWKDDTHMIRLERGLMGRVPGPDQPVVTFGDVGNKLIMRRVDGDDRIIDDLAGQVVDQINPNNPLWLRIVRKGDKARSEFSVDGKKWASSREFPLSWKGELLVGVSASNTLDRPFSTKILDIKVEKPK